jgi:anaerobic magnesium-protoporphyrin IX monomethyl ester cyclase
MCKKYKLILLLKVPYCEFPGSQTEEESFRTKSTFRPVPSLALATLCAFIDKYKSYDYNLKAIDINIEAYKKPNIPIDISSYDRLLSDCIKNNEYDVLAISAAFVYNIKWVEKTVKLSRIYHPDAKIIVGGGYPTLFPEKCLKELDVNDVVIGEGEAAILHILNRYNGYRDYEFEKNFSPEGYISREDNGQKKFLTRRQSFLNLEYLPMPAWHYLNINKYFENSGDRIIPIEASRGCPYNCAYCSTYISWGRKIRYKSIDNLIMEMVEIEKTYKLDGFHFVDDNMSFSKPWFVELFKNLINVRLPIKIYASNFSVKHLDEEIIDIMIEAGMRFISIAVESGSADIQRRIRKNINFDQVRELVKMLKSKKGITIHVCWMLGFPGETIKQIHQTFDFARELNTGSNQFLTVLPYPGTKLFEDAKEDGLLIFDEHNLDKFDNRKCDYLKSDEWNYKQLEEMIYDINIELNFIKNPLLDNLESAQEMLEWLEKLLLMLPGHIIAHVIAGYIYKKNRDAVNCQKHYEAAVNLFKNKVLHDTFIRYLSWQHPIINEFNQYIEKNSAKIGAYNN